MPLSGQGIFIHIRVNATRASQASWGDTQFAASLADAIRRHPGCDGALLFRGEVPGATDRPAVLLQIIGPHLEEPVPGLANLLWMISPPNVAPLAMLGRYQAMFCGSQLLTYYLRQRGLAVRFLPQATATGHFHPRRRPPGAAEIPLVFVGGYAPRVDRRLVIEAVRQGFEPQIWGPGWRGVVPDRLWRGERLDYDALANTYACARVVLNSHMAHMAALGFMSNRSYDALAAGAMVVSDSVPGFRDDDLGEIVQVADADALPDRLASMLAAPAADIAGRIALHDRVAARHGFDARAATILDCARGLLAGGQVARAAFAAGRGGSGAAPRLSDPAASAPDSRQAMLAAGQEILAIARHLEQPGAAPPLPRAPAAQQGVIHPLMADLREIQRIALHGADSAALALLPDLAGRARRVVEILRDPDPLLGPRSTAAEQDRVLVDVMHNRPLWFHSPDGFVREEGKVSLPLWPRRELPPLAREPGVFLHLYHDDLAPVFAERLAALACPVRLYVSTDTEAKANRIRAALPGAEIRVLENRGRDIWPKLYGFADCHDRHDIVLHLHGKKSPHSGSLDSWLAHILECLLGSEGEVNRILSFFASIPRLGMVMPVTFRNVLAAAHWGANRDIARELAARMGLQTPLPGDDALRFPAGSMFWARTAAIRPLLDLRLQPGHFPPEAGQIDGTLAHALERMLGVVCQATGHHILPVAGTRSRLHVKHRMQARSNGELRDMLEGAVVND